MLSLTQTMPVPPCDQSPEETVLQGSEAAHPVYFTAVASVELPAMVPMRTTDATADGAGLVVSPTAKLGWPVT